MVASGEPPAAPARSVVWSCSWCLAAAHDARWLARLRVRHGGGAGGSHGTVSAICSPAFPLATPSTVGLGSGGIQGTPAPMWWVGWGIVHGRMRHGALVRPGSVAATGSRTCRMGHRSLQGFEER